MDPLTLLEKLRPSEAIEHLELLSYSNRDGWEQARMVSYVIAQINSKNSMTPQTIMRFPWDEQPQKVEVTAEDKERLRKRSEQIAKQLYG